MGLLMLVVMLVIGGCVGDFSPPTSDYDAYGLKIAGNDIMLVEAEDDNSLFLIQFAPYNYTSQPLQCAIEYDDSSHYMYSVGIGVKQQPNDTYFYFIGEAVSNGSSTAASSSNTSPFIGVLANTDPQSAQMYAATQQPLNCDLFGFTALKFISPYGHQEFFVFGVEPYGQYAIGLAKDFAFIYWPFSDNDTTIKNSSLVWPANRTFMPVAADSDVLYTIVVGFVSNGDKSRVRVTPTLYVISNSNLTVRATWSYAAAPNSWQSRLTYSGFEGWLDQYIMSVDINPSNATQVLVGMPFLNTVFLFSVSQDGSSITLASSIDNGKSVGFGKSVAWLPNSQVAILISPYPPDSSAIIYLYTSPNNMTLPSSPAFVIPSSSQPVTVTIDATLIRIISTPTSLAILDVYGSILFIVPASPGYFASTNIPNSNLRLTLSQPSLCMAGTYKGDTSIYPCSLCPSGSRNPGNLPATSCINCSSQAFCPTGAVAEVNTTFLLPRSQAYAYPRSPESTIFDDILLLNMFSIGSSGHCVLVSPIFWVIIAICIVFIILLCMGILKWCARDPKHKRWHANMKKVLRQTDLIEEGEMWMGGLVSFAVVVLLIFAYTFSGNFYQQYPGDTVGPSTFACDETLRNAKYDSSLQSLAVPISEEEEPMFDLLTNQTFTFHLDLLNTVASCTSLSVQQILGSSSVTLKAMCVQGNGIVSANVSLPLQAVTLQWVLADIALVGGVRIGLSGDGAELESYTLKELDASQTFYDTSKRTLAQIVNIVVDLTKAINETEPLTTGESEFSGIWYAESVVDEYDMFLSAEQYATSANLTSTTLNIVISETSYYIQNLQQPIAKQQEIIFHNLLFTIVCLEIFGLVFLIFKLAILPLLKMILKRFHKTSISSSPKGSVHHGSLTHEQDISVVHL